MAAVITEPQVSSEAFGQVEGRSPGQLFWMRFRRDRLAIAGAIFIVFLIALALVAPLLADVVGHQPDEIFQREMTTTEGLPKGPNGDFWFGGDRLGRDAFVRTLYGLRTSLIVAFGATGFAVVIGVFLGVMAGYFRGWVDTTISRLTDIVLSLPLLLFAIGIASACSDPRGNGCLAGIIKPGLGLVVFVIALFSWTYVARLIRGQVLSIRERDFVDASRSLGASDMRIMFREVLPNLIAPIVIYSTLIVPANILFEAYLSYLGVGIRQVPSLGAMISDASSYYEQAWWLLVFPGFFLVSLTLAFNLLGDGLRDALDPRTKV